MYRALTVACLLVLAGCQRSHTENEPQILRFSAIPDQPWAQVLQQHQALVDRVCAAVKKTCQWVTVSSYDGLVERLGRKEIDVAYLGSATFVQASHRFNAVPLVMRDIDFRFTSVIVVRKSSLARNLDDLRQTRFSFGDRNSTSGHLMLRQRLQGEHIVPERYFSQVVYAANHDATIQAVASGQVDAGGVNASVFYKRLTARDPAAMSLRAVWQTAPFTDYVWAAGPQLPSGLRQALIEAFLDLDLGSAADASALQAENAAGFVPAFPSDFDEMTRVLRSQGNL